MKVLLVFSSSELGGAERSLTRMALAPSRNINFTLATLDGKGPWETWARGLGANPVVFGDRKKQQRHGSFGLTALWKLVCLVRKERYAVIYVIGYRASLWLRLLRPLLAGACLVHGIRWNPDSNSTLDRALCITERFLGGLVDLYICNSQASANTLTHRAGVSKAKLAVIHNGLNWIPPANENERTPEANVIILANLSPRKGHTEFLDIIKIVCSKVPNTHFFFVGRDDMNGELTREILLRGLENSITLTGYQSDVGTWLSRSRLMVLPSKRGEGCPTSILEGFSYRLPVVAYSVDGIPELVSNGIDGYIVSPDDPTAFASSIVELLKNDQLTKEMGDRGRIKVERSFTLNYCAQLHSEVLHGLIHKNENNF